VRSYAVTDVGRVRKNNEDSLLQSDMHRLYAVADGMGGHNAGEVASLIAVETLYLYEMTTGINGVDNFKEAFAEANRNILQTSMQERSTYGMGTTLTAVKIIGEYALYGHIGDSRLYFLNDRLCYQLSEDHSLVWEHFRAGILTKEECRFHPQKNIITKALGQFEDVDLDLGVIKLRRDGLFLLCSDGLTDMLSEAAIKSIVKAHYRSPERILEVLHREALSAGGVDNISFLMLVFDAEDGAKA